MLKPILRLCVILILCSLPLSTFPLRAAPSAELKVQLGHSDVVTGVAFSLDDRWAITASDDTTARLWDVATGREIRRFEGHAADVTSVVALPDGQSLLTGSRDHTARLWNLATGREVRRFEGHSQTILAVASSRDGAEIATSSSDGTARVWQTATGRELRRVELPAESVYSVALSPDGRMLVTGASIGDVKMWDVATGGQIRSFDGHRLEVRSLAISPDGQSILSGAEDRTARLWDAATGREIARLQLPTTVTSVAFFPDGATAIVGVLDGTSRIWNLSTGLETGRVAGHSEAVLAVAVSHDGRAVLTGSVDRSARVWDVEDGRELRRLEGQAGMVFIVAFSPDGRFVLTGGSDHNASLWNLESGRLSHVLTGHTAQIFGAAFSASSGSALTGSVDGTARVWDVGTGREIGRLANAQPVSSVQFAPDGRSALTGDLFGNVRAWNVEAATTLREFRAIVGPVHAIAIAPDGRTAIVGGEAARPRRLNLENGDERGLADAHSEDIAAVAFSPDGRLVVTGSWDGTARIWNAATGEGIRTLEVPKSQPNPLTYATGALSFVGRTQRLWEDAVGRMIRRLGSHPDAINAAVFSPDGRFILTGGEDKTARLWDVATGREIRRFEGHADPVLSVAFSPDGRFALTGSIDGTTKVWDVADARLLATMIAFRDGGWAVVDPEGRYDAADPDGSLGLYWQLQNEIVDLKQLKLRFYEPRLLAKLLGFNPEPLRPVAGLNDVQLWPAAEVQPPIPGQSPATIRLTDRGGGIGRVVIKVNGRELPSATRGVPVVAGVPIAIDLSAAQLAVGGENHLELTVYAKDNVVASRGLVVTWTQTPENAGAPAVLRAIVAGVSEYGDSALALRYPAKDAIDIAHALDIGGARMFGTDRIDVTTLATGTALEPTKTNLQAAFERIASRAGPSDVVLVYLAGHGVAGSAGSDLYYYLTRDARTTNPQLDPALWRQSTVSSAELLEWLRRKGMPLRQVVVLDTCAAGAAIGELLKLANARDLTADQSRALELLKDATGSHILMGAAADKVSYEASRYGQGLLTYSLLLGMRGEALDEGGRLDVRQWFATAQRRVPELARGIGGIQQPVVSSPGGQSFPIALFTPEDRGRIPLPALKPQLLRATAHNADDRDPLNLESEVRAGLRVVSTPAARGPATGDPPLVYLDQVAGDVADAYLPQVLYEVDGSTVQIRLRLVAANGTKDVRQEMKFSADSSRPAEIAARIVDTFVTMLAALR